MLNIKDINHVVYRHRDLDEVERFMTDFGLVRASRTEHQLYMRGAGSAPYAYVAEQAESPAFVAVAFAVERAEDLSLARTLPGASAIESLQGPGGGHAVTLHDPAGRRVQLVHGIEPVASLPMRPALVLNSATFKRRFGEVQRPPRAPAQVLRLGHIALGVSDLRACLDWYTQTLGLLPSDFVVDESNKSDPHAAFLRLNRGDEWTDHHTVALFQSAADHVHHASFEVQDFDAQLHGNAWLSSQGWSPVWGVGRHVLGSQIFDYWRDPSGNVVEHFTDGDLYQRDSPLGYTPASDDSLYQWGPSMTVEHFLGSALTKR